MSEVVICTRCGSEHGKLESFPGKVCLPCRESHPISALRAGAVAGFIRRWREIDPDGVWGEVYVDDVTELLPDGSEPVERYHVLTVTRSDSDDVDVWPAVGDVDGEPVYRLDGWMWVSAAE